MSYYDVQYHHSVQFHPTLLETLYDAYLHHRQTRETTDYMTREGQITFNYYPEYKEMEHLVVIYVIQVARQREGIFARLLQAITSDTTMSVCVACVGGTMDAILSKMVLRGRPFVAKSCDYFWTP